MEGVLALTAKALFAPFKLGAIELARRVHAPTTRFRAEADETPSEMMLEYYEQRASQGGLTEASHPSHNSCGYEGAPGIYTVDLMRTGSISL